MVFNKILKLQFVVVLLFQLQLFAQENDLTQPIHDFELEIAGQYRYFLDDPKFEGQETHFPSIAVQPKYSLEWKDGYESINFLGFYRWDVDGERTHGDIRELYYQKAHNNWELNIGLKKVYWGVTESNHLVDIINQTDAIESFDGEQKLGQPMIQFNLFTERFGSFDFFYLPYHRKRVFPGEKGRLRFPVVITKNDIGYESNAAEWRQDLAFRWSHYFGALDIGVSHFYGNGREPLIIFNKQGNIEAYYPVINQTGIDL